MPRFLDFHIICILGPEPHPSFGVPRPANTIFPARLPRNDPSQSNPLVQRLQSFERFLYSKVITRVAKAFLHWGHLKACDRLTGRRVGGVVCRIVGIKLEGCAIPSTEKGILLEGFQDIGP